MNGVAAQGHPILGDKPWRSEEFHFHPAKGPQNSSPTILMSLNDAQRKQVAAWVADFLEGVCFTVEPDGSTEFHRILALAELAGC